MYAARATASEIQMRHPALHPLMRSMLVDWLALVCQEYSLRRETFYLAVDFVDRYLSLTKNVPKHRLQLIGKENLFRDMGREVVPFSKYILYFFLKKKP